MGTLIFLSLSIFPISKYKRCSTIYFYFYFFLQSATDMQVEIEKQWFPTAVLSVMVSFSFPFFPLCLLTHIVLGVMWSRVCVNDSCVSLECANERWGLCILGLSICGCWEALSGFCVCKGKTYLQYNKRNSWMKLSRLSWIVWSKYRSRPDRLQLPAFSLPLLATALCL